MPPRVVCFIARFRHQQGANGFLNEDGTGAESWRPFGAFLLKTESNSRLQILHAMKAYINDEIKKEELKCSLASQASSLSSSASEDGPPQKLEHGQSLSSVS
jgi:hypothetical protein